MNLPIDHPLRTIGIQDTDEIANISWDLIKSTLLMVDECEKSEINQPQPLFTRTAYTKEELFAHIESIEQLGFTSYDIVRGVEDIKNIVVPHLPAGTKPRWIIKVYGTEEETK